MGIQLSETPWQVVERGVRASTGEAEYHERTKELVSRTESKISAMGREDAL